jgi:hypothetical protein
MRETWNVHNEQYESFQLRSHPGHKPASREQLAL